LAGSGMVDVEQRVTGLAQFVSGSRPLVGQPEQRYPGNRL
jgi:hypothetical protein